MKTHAVCLALAIGLTACGGGSSSGPSTPATPTSPSPAPPAPAPGPSTVAGTVVDGLAGTPLAGVTVSVADVGEAMTTADGAFSLSATAPESVHVTTISSPDVVQRTTRLRAPGPPAALSLIPGSFDLNAYDQMFRSSGGALHRWTAPPRVLVLDRVLQFTSTTDTQFTALAATMTDGEVGGLLDDLRWTLPQLTGNTFSSFAGEDRESPAEGVRVSVSRPGLIVVARYEGLTNATGFWGYTRWSWNGAGELQAGIMMLDRSFEVSGSPFRRSLRAHEFGHALGYEHVSTRPSVMNSNARTEPNDFDRGGAKLAFQRTPLNRTPDIDPDPFTGNFRTTLYWAGDR